MVIDELQRLQQEYVVEMERVESSLYPVPRDPFDLSDANDLQVNK